MITQSIKDTVTTKHDEVMEVLSDCKLRNLWLSDDDSFFASILRMLSLDVTERARNRKTSWNDPMRPQYEMLLRLVLPRYLHVLDRLSLVDATTVFDDALHLVLFVWPVIPRE